MGKWCYYLVWIILYFYTQIKFCSVFIIRYLFNSYRLLQNNVIKKFGFLNYNLNTCKYIPTVSVFTVFSISMTNIYFLFFFVYHILYSNTTWIFVRNRNELTLNDKKVSSTKETLIHVFQFFSRYLCFSSDNLSH